MNDARELVRILDRLAWEAKESGDEEMAQWAKDEREKHVLRVPKSLDVNCATGDMISPSGVFDDEAIAHFERLRRRSLFTYEALADIEAIIAAQADEDDPPAA